MISGLLVLFALILTLALLGEIPAWSLRGGTRFTPRVVLPPHGAFPVKLPPGATILVRGDSNSTATRIAGARAWPEWLAERLGPGVRVDVQAHGGNTTNDAVERYGTVARGTNLCIFSLGTNDAAPRGRLSGHRPVPLSTYAHQMTAMISSCRMTGAEVIVLAPFAGGSPAIARRLEPYRLAARELAVANGVRFLDPGFTIATDGLGASPDDVMLKYDALHLNRVAHERFSGWLAQSINIVDDSQSIDDPGF